MACTGQYATAREYAELICTRTLDLSAEARVNRQLILTSGALHAAMSASNQCTCDLADWAVQYLKHLNIILAAATQDCPCSTVSAEDKAAYLAFANAEMEKIRTRQIDLCGGTGRNYPAVGAIQYGLNVFNDAQLITDRLKKQGY